MYFRPGWVKLLGPTLAFLQPSRCNMEVLNFTFDNLLDLVVEGLVSGDLDLSDSEMSDTLCTNGDLSVFKSMKEWPMRYFNRFVKWYCRRNKVSSLDCILIKKYSDFVHHAINWDSGLRKAMLKNKEIDKLRRQLRNDKLKDRKAAYKFPKTGVMNPKTCTIQYVDTEILEVLQEQGDSGQEVTNLESTSQTTSTANITFVDERPVDSTSLHTGQETFSRDTHNDIAENDWTMSKVLTREYPLQNFEWKVGATWENTVYTNGIPKVITDDSQCMITRQLQFFSFLRAGIKIRVQLNGTKFHCGRLIVYFKPLTWIDDTEENFYSVTCYPHFFLDASVSNSGEIVVPYTHLLSYFSQESGTLFNDSINSLGFLNVRVYNALQAADESSQSLFGQIYVSLVDPYVHLPTSGITRFSYGTGYMQGLEALLKKSAGSLINTGLGLADKFTGGLVTGAGDAICNLLGICDKPLDPVSAAPIVNRTIAPLSHGAGLDRSTRLGLSPIAQTNTTPAILGASDSDFNLLTLCKMPCLLDQVEWNSTATVGTKLFDMLVTPTYLSNPQYTADGTGKFTNYSPTMLAYVARAFCLWRGSLKVKIQVIATQFHSGRLALVYDPHGSTKVDLQTFDQNKSHNLVIMDIQEKQELVVELPNFMVRPWLRCDKFRSDANLKNLSNIVNATYLDCDVAGIFRIFVMNGLVQPNNVTNKVQINVFFYAGDNFELTIPNPVAPLSARKGPTGIQYMNAPRYPWCTRGTAQLCKSNDAVLDLYNTGKQLVEDGLLEIGVNWYTTKEAVFTQDTATFVYEGKKIAYYVDNNEGTCVDFIKGLPNYTKPTFAVEQGLESYTTTRENDGGVVTITDGNKKSVVAPDTVSENAMNMQTLLRRFYPLWISSNFKHANSFTVITIPVSPAFVPSDEETYLVSGINRHYDIHNLAWWSRLYTYWRGSMRYKVLVNASEADIYVWHNPVDTKNFHVSSGLSYEHVTEQLNFATEAAVTRVQQGVEVEVPFYSAFNQLLHSHVTNKADLRSQNGTLYIAIRNGNVDFNVAVFVSTGDDFFLNVLRAPPILHEPGQDAYVNSTEDNTLIQYPDLQRSMGHSSSTMQIPETYVFDRFDVGQFRNCNFSSFADEKDFRSIQLPAERQQMCEQGITQIIDSYNEVMDTVRDVRKTSNETKEFITELREDVLPAVLGHAKVFHQDLNDTHQTIKNFLPQIQEVFDYTNAAAVGVKNTAEVLSDTAKVVGGAASYVEWFGETLCISGIWLNIVSLHQKFTYTGLVNITIMLSSLFKVQAQKIINWLWNHAKEIYEDYRSKATNGTVATEQGLVDFLADYQQEFSFGLAAVATVLYCALFGTMPTWSTIKEAVKKTVSKGKEQAGGISDFLKSVHFSNLGFKAINSAFTFFHEWIQDVVNKFLGKEAREVLLEKEFKEKAKEIEKWIDDIASLEDEDYYNLALSDIDVHNKFYRLVDQGNKFTKWLMNEGVSKNVSSVIRDTNRKLNEMVKRINEIRPAHGFRYAPFSVWFHGETSTGKSQMMHAITDIIRKELNIPYYNSVYAVPTTDKYLSGYNGQTIVEWDDILQNTNQDELVGQYINWCSNADCKLNMADLADKGKHFTSKAIIATSNCSYINVNVVRDMAAFRRRRNVMIGVQFAEGWNAERMEDAEHDPEFRHAIFAILRNDKEQVVRENMTFAEVKEYIKGKFTTWNEKQNCLVNDYMERHGSLRIPKGVIIEEEEEVSNEDFEDALEQSCKVVVCYRDSSATLTDMEEIDAEIFINEFNELCVEEQVSYYHKFKQMSRKVVKKAKSIFTLLKRKFSLCVDEFSFKIKEIYNKYPTLLKALGVVGTLVTTGLFLKTLYGMFNATLSPEGDIENPLTSQPTQVIKAEDAYTTNTPKVKTQLVKAENSVYETTSLKVPTRIVKAEGMEHGTYDPAAVEMARNKIHPLMTIVGWHETEYQSIMQCLAIGGKFILVPHHFFRRAKVGEFFWFLRGRDKILVEFSPQRMQRIRDKDACIYYVGAQFDSRKNIVDCFISEDKLSLVSKSCPAILLGTTSHGVILEKSCTAKGNVELSYKGTDDGAPTYVQHGWYYDIDTLNGECGSPLIATSKMLPPPAKILGIHVAGYTNKRGGFSIILTKEMIMEALQPLVARFGAQVTGMRLPTQVNQDEKVFDEQCKIVPQGSFSYYGTMQANMCPSQPCKTQLKPTPFQGECYPVVKAPAKLKPDKNGSPLLKALGKYGKLTTPFKIKHIQAVRNSILNDLMELKSELPCEPVSTKTAIFGIEGMKYCEKLNMRSSPGWPYQCLAKARGQVGKAYLFDINAKTISDELLKRNFEARELMAQNGERFPSIWRDCLKDELRPLEKVEACKTRLFTIAPVDYTILVRKYFLSFEQAFYAGHTKFFSAVGINPESFEWTESYNRLRSYGNKCIAGDFSCFDGTLMADLMYECGEIINDWYALNGDTSETHALVRRVLIDEMIHTYQLVQNCVYKTHQGNPSGNPLTVILNTMVNAFYMRLAWMEILSEKNPILATMDTYQQNVMEEMYGDDNRLVIKQPMLQYFNQVSVTECLAKHGIVYTDESKSSTLIPFRELLDTSFLKRSYRFDEEVGKEVVLPVMQEDTITSLTNWYRDSDDLDDQLQMNQRAASYFAFFHGRKYFNTFQEKLVTKMREFNIKPLSLTYDEYLNIFLDDIHGGSQKFRDLVDFGYN